MVKELFLWLKRLLWSKKCYGKTDAGVLKKSSYCGKKSCCCGKKMVDVNKCLEFFCGKSCCFGKKKCVVKVW